MAKSTLEVIQAIEDKAEKIDQEYKDQIAVLEERQRERLESETLLLKEENEKALEEFKAQLEQELVDAREALEKAQAQYTEQTNEAMTGMRDELIDNIVIEVVNKYGN